MKFCLFPLLIALIASSAAAASANNVVRADPAEFAASRAKLEESLRDSDRFGELTSSKRAEVMQALDRMQHTLAGIDSVASLDPEAKAQLFNDQEMVNSVITQAAEASRLVCKRSRKVGSHRTTTTCRSVAEMRREREAAQDTLEIRQRQTWAPARD